MWVLHPEIPYTSIHGFISCSRCCSRHFTCFTTFPLHTITTSSRKEVNAIHVPNKRSPWCNQCLPVRRNTRRYPSRYCNDARVNRQRTAVIHHNEYSPVLPLLCSPDPTNARLYFQAQSTRQQQERRPSIEIPANTDVSWPGHRFSLKSVARSVLSRVSTPAQEVALRHDPVITLSAFDSSESEQSAPKSTTSRESHVPALAELGCYRAAGTSSLMTVTQPGEVQKLRTPGVHGVWSIPVTPAQERCVRRTRDKSDRI